MSKIQKIQQLSRNELIFLIRNLGESKKLYINFNPEFYHLCFMSKENEQKRNLTIPKTAPMFCMLLRKYIQNAKILKIEVPEYERIFEIYFEYFDELNEKSQLCLAIELMGKHSNVILYNYLKSGWNNALNHFLSNNSYNIKKGYVLSNERKIYTDNNIIYLPIYFVMFLNND